jgi:hypothetical protein
LARRAHLVVSPCLVWANPTAAQGSVNKICLQTYIHIQYIVKYTHIRTHNTYISVSCGQLSFSFTGYNFMAISQSWLIQPLLQSLGVNVY